MFFSLFFFISLTLCAFYECEKELAPLTSDSEALQKVKAANEDKFKFSSACLELLLKKNFFNTSNFLISDYYPKTSIDTEIIAKNVANELKRN